MGSRVCGYQFQPGARESVMGNVTTKMVYSKGHPADPGCNRLAHNLFFSAGNRLGRDRVPVEFLSGVPPFLPNIECS
jgi:hypothetical protein